MSDKEKTTIRSKGSNIDDAINEALLRLGARRDEVEITVVSEGKPGVLGVFGRKRAEVEVTRKAKGGRSRGGGGRDRNDGRRRNEGRGRGRGDGRRDGARVEARDGDGRRGGRSRDDRNRDEKNRDDRSKNERSRNDRGRDEPRREATRRPEGEGERPRRRRRNPAEGDAKRETAPRQETSVENRPPRTEDNRDEGERRPRRRRGGRGRGRRRRPEDGAPAGAPQQEAAAVDGNTRTEVDGNVRTESRGADEARTERTPDGERKPRERRPRERREPRERRPREDRQAAARIEEDKTMETPRPSRPTETPMPPTGEPIAVAETTPRIATASMEDAPANVKELTGELLRRCSFMASVRTLERDGDRLPVRVVVDTDSVEAMVGRRSTAISSVQHLVERLNQRATGEFLPLDMDINNYRQRQDGKLMREAKDAMSRVQQSGDDDHLPPMNARERRVIHMEVAEVDGLATYTQGKGMDRHVVICVDRGKDNPPSEPDDPRP